MNLTKKNIQEIIDGNGNLIGKNDVPNSGGDKETEANKTTDYNSLAHGQNFRNNFFGILGLPFYEGEEEKPTEITNKIAELMYSRFVEFLNYYHENPEELEKDFQTNQDQTFESQPEERKQIDYQWAKKFIDTLEPYLKEIEKQGALNEEVVVEDKLLEKKEEPEFSEKKSNKDLIEKQIEKLITVADKLKKLKKDELDKLVNLLEKK